jgi:hypothetical protein
VGVTVGLFVGDSVFTGVGKDVADPEGRFVGMMIGVTVIEL